MAADAPARFIRRVVANDNDCLFSAILYLTEGGAIAPGGAAVIEIGHRQAAAVTAMIEGAGLAAALHRDLGGRDRCLVVTA